jgi:eukaryotic-like serine/threonine-protein kinase
MSLLQGQIINNRFRTVKLLGQGGYGAVYRAWDTVLNRHCALKENLETSPEAQRQFIRETRILANLNHPNLPRVTDHFVIPGQGQYLVMDFIEGDDLQKMLDDHPGSPLPESQVLHWIEQVCDALEYLHSQNIIHRDIKPANIRITPQGDAILVDFGIAKVYDSQMKTAVGARAVTPGFSPPEQYGQGSTDSRSDIYALGATLYNLLTAQVPTESLQRIVRDRSLLRKLNPGISDSVKSTIRRAMQIDPDLRFQSAPN